MSWTGAPSVGGGNEGSLHHGAMLLGVIRCDVSMRIGGVTPIQGIGNIHGHKVTPIRRTRSINGA
jgi:hypothetical protein